MSATQRRDTVAAHATVIDFDVFDEACKEQGAVDEEARAELVGTDRVTLWRWRTGRTQPGLRRVAGIATTLGVTVDELLGGRAA